VHMPLQMEDSGLSTENMGGQPAKESYSIPVIFFASQIIGGFYFVALYISRGAHVAKRISEEINANKVTLKFRFSFFMAQNVRVGMYSYVDASPTYLLRIFCLFLGFCHQKEFEIVTWH